MKLIIRKVRTLTDLVSQTKEQELTGLSEEINGFSDKCTEPDSGKTGMHFFSLLLTKADKAIKDVGKENGFIYIFDVSQGSSVVYFDETKSTNVMPLAKAKLGLK